MGIVPQTTEYVRLTANAILDHGWPLAVRFLKRAYWPKDSQVHRPGEKRRNGVLGCPCERRWTVKADENGRRRLVARWAKNH